MNDALGRRHINGLDGLRGAAVAAVLVFHAGHLTGGWLGVDLFFVLSGFLITSLLLSESVRRGTISLPSFWARRARRLLPALFLMLLGVGVYAAVWAAPRELDSIRTDALATLGYVANWQQIAHGQQYFDLFRSPSPLQHTWSLAIEEQFYVLWPLVVVGVLAWRRSTRAVLIVSIVGVVASFTTMLALYTPGSDPQRVYLGADTRASSILLGAALAALVATLQWTTSRPQRAVIEVLGLAGAGFLAWAWLSLAGSSSSVYGGVLLACSIAAMLVIAAVAHPNPGPLARVLSFQPLCALGIISYGVYLWHWPVYLVADADRVGLDGWALTAVRVALTLAIAAVSFVVVERPIRRGVLPGWPIRTLAGAAVAMVLVVVLVTTVPPSVPPANAASALRQLARSGELGSEGTESPLTSTTLPSASVVRVTVVGDSIANRLMPAFRDLAGPMRLEVTDRTTVGCNLHRGATAARTDDINGSAGSETAGSAASLGNECSADWADVAARDRPDVVLVVMAGSILGEWLVEGQWTHPCEEPFDGWYEQQLLDALSLLTVGGVRVALALPAPTLDAEFVRRTECVRALERRVARTLADVSPIDFSDLVCGGGHCIDEIDGITLREDGIHYEGPAAELVVRWLTPKLRAIALGPPGEFTR